MCGNCAKGRLSRATPPARMMRIDSTEAKIGRSMKKRENTRRGSVGGWEGARLAGDDVGNAIPNCTLSPRRLADHGTSWMSPPPWNWVPFGSWPGSGWGSAGVSFHHITPHALFAALHTQPTPQLPAGTPLAN